MTIRHALLEGLIQLIRHDSRITLVNLRCLPFRMRRVGDEFFVCSKGNQINLRDLREFILEEK
jgi:hypothetical protein